MIETPQIVETPAQLIAAIHIEAPRSKIQQIMGPGIGEAMAAVKTQASVRPGRGLRIRLTQPASLASLHLRKQVPPYRTQCARCGAPQVAKSN
jgi:hypothetical protein